MSDWFGKAALAGASAIFVAVLGFGAVHQLAAPSQAQTAKEAPTAVLGLRDDPTASSAAFVQVASVLSHPRCQNCHTLTDFPRQGDDRHRHVMNVRRGPDGHGLPGMTCTTCHGRANNEASGVPGADEDWHLAPLSMGWEGVTLREMCENLKNPVKNGGRDGAKVIDHLNTHLVEWGWTPGRDKDGRARSVPPLSHDAFVAVAKRWVETGAHCPTGAIGERRTPITE